MTPPRRSTGTERESDGAGRGGGLDAHRHGLHFQLIVDPDDVAWIEVRRADGELVDFQRHDDECIDVDSFADDWVEGWLVDIDPLSRCVECGLAVELVVEDRQPARRMRHAAEYYLAVWVPAVEEAFHEDVVLCMRCRSEMLLRYNWLRPLLSRPRDPRRAR